MPNKIYSIFGRAPIILLWTYAAKQELRGANIFLSLRFLSHRVGIIDIVYIQNIKGGTLPRYLSFNGTTENIFICGDVKTLMKKRDTALIVIWAAISVSQLATGLGNLEENNQLSGYVSITLSIALFLLVLYALYSVKKKGKFLSD